MSNDREETTLTLNSRRAALKLLALLFAIELLLVLGDLIINFGRLSGQVPIRAFFNIAREGSLASWFSSSLFILPAINLGFIFLLERNRPHMRWRRWGWLLLALFFLYLSMDDGAQFHERFGSAVRALAAKTPDASRTLPGEKVVAYPGYSWQIVFAPFFGFMAFFILFFLYYEFDDRLSLLFFIAGLSLFVVAVGLDFIEGLERHHPLNLLRKIQGSLQLADYTVEHLQKVLEEFLEMLGTSFFWCAFLNHTGRLRAVRIEFVGGKPDPG